MLKTHIATLIGALSLALVGCSDDKTNESVKLAEVLDPADLHYGKSYSEWNAEWFRWIYEIPFTDDCHLPVDDATGEYCDQAQTGDVFFLAGALASDKIVVVRDQCTIPAGKPLLFPLMNSIADNGGVPQGQELSAEENRAAAADFVDQVVPENLFASVDDQDIPNLERFQTDVVKFSYYLPREPNFYTCLGAAGVTGAVDPSFAGGYYIMLAPLSAGRHEIRFGLDQPDDLFSTDITYHLTVR